MKNHFHLLFLNNFPLLIMESTGEEAIDSSPIRSLPTETLQSIFSDLPIHERLCVKEVCKTWKKVSIGRVWRDKQVLIIAPRYQGNFDLFCYPFEDSNKFNKFNTMKNHKLYIDFGELGVIESLVSHAGQNIKEFIFDSCYQDGEPVLSIFATHCHNIESIQFGRVCSSDVQVFSRIFEVNETLHSIACRYVDNFIKRLPLRDWKSLYIGGATDLEEEYREKKMLALIENSPSLETFHFCEWTLNIAKAISRCKELKNLFFPISNKEVRNYLMMDTSLLNRLTCLKVQGQKNEEYLIIYLLRHCLNSETLHLILDYKISDEVEKVMMDLPKLESLELATFSLTDGLLSRLGKFKDLRLKDSYGLIREDKIFEMIINSECLEKLEIFNWNITSKLFKRLAQTGGRRCEILKIRINPKLYEEVLEICEGSEIHIITEFDDLVSDRRNWI